jgi:hypothetical protein
MSWSSVFLEPACSDREEIDMHTPHVRVGFAVLATVMVGVTAFAVSPAAEGHDGSRVIDARLSGYQENPLALSSAGAGHFRARVDTARQEIRYKLTYDGLEGDVTQAHIHLGSPSQVGGVSVFLCTNLGNGPAGTQACPASPGTVTGTIHAVDVIGPAGQGIAAGEFAELLAAIRANSTYVNVHSTLYPVGEIRSQLIPDHHHFDHH